MKLIPMRFSSVYSIAQQHFDAFLQTVHDSEAVDNSGDDEPVQRRRIDNGPDGSQVALSHMAEQSTQSTATLVKLAGIIECLQHYIRFVDEEDEDIANNDTQFSAFVQPLFQVLVQVNNTAFEEGEYRILCPLLVITHQIGMHAEYVKTLIIETAERFLSGFDAQFPPPTQASQPKKATGKRKAHAAGKSIDNTATEYDATSIIEDTRQVVLAVQCEYILR